MFGPYWSVTKYNDIMDDRHQPRGVLVGRLARRHHHPRRRRRICAARASSPWTSRSTTRSARPWRRCSRRPHLDKLAINIRERSAECLDNLPDQRGVRLGRQGLDRADHADAGDAVRLPVGGAPQADPLVRRRDHHSRPGGARRDRRGAAGRAAGMRDLFRASSGTSASSSRRRAT